MLKRTKGYVLLTLLVITGLAGTLNNTTLSNKERKFAITYLKETKNDILNATKDLSDAQLNFKPGPDRWSVKECVQHIALAEKGLWSMVETSMKQSANSDKRSEITFTDDGLINKITDRTNKVKNVEPMMPDNAAWPTFEATLHAFKDQRDNLIQYVKNTTEDMRNHVIQAPVGMMDAYQMVLLVSAHSNRHTQQINEVKTEPYFPKH